MLGYAKCMKDLVTKKRSVTFEDDDRIQHCSAIATRSLVQKKEDPGAFTIPCTIGLLHLPKALCDLATRINLIPLSIYKKLGSGDPKPIAIRLLMADRTVKRPIGILHDVLVKVESFIFLADFVILYCEVDFEVPKKVTPMPRPPPPFPQRLVKKTEDGKYRRFITMLKQLSINVPLVEALEQMPDYAKFMKDLVTKKRSVTFEDDDRMQHCSAIATKEKRSGCVHYSLYSRVITFCESIM